MTQDGERGDLKAGSGCEIWGNLDPPCYWRCSACLTCGEQWGGLQQRGCVNARGLLTSSVCQSKLILEVRTPFHRTRQKKFLSLKTLLGKCYVSHLFITPKPQKESLLACYEPLGRLKLTYAPAALRTLLPKAIQGMP